MDTETDISSWAARLAAALDVLAQSVTATRYYPPALTNEQYRALAQGAVIDRDGRSRHPHG